MIKLNNKNITYVALADSNNSLKAPKEIWYADSNNSVKLVYRRKDALIEGEDYEKYHWLDGDGTAYIDTGIIVPKEKFVCITRLRNRETRTEPNSYFAFTVRQQSVANFPFISVNPRTDEQRYYVDLTNPRSYVPFGSGAVDINIAMPSANTIQGDLMFFKSKNLSFGKSPWIGDISSFSLTSLDSTFRVEMQPCKLLKPVPKWLDANGIRRQVGECGMIDLVSGKFYGNVNSVGTFTVENYYERKEWLKGDGNAYIDTGIIVDVPSLYISTSFTKKVGNNTPLFGARDIFSGSGSQIFYLSNGNLRFDIITKGTNWISVNSSNVQNINQLIIDCPNKVININEITLSSGVDDLSIKNSSNTFKIYSLELLNSSDSNNVPYHGAFGNFTLNDSTHSLNLIPCTLTMDLPASMDANNIARTKGTSGMWDLVSDRFYGNVANSGTFKAVNLAEGVDYEVHQWLVAEIYPQTSLMRIPINSSNFSYIKENGNVRANLAHFSASEYTYLTDDVDMEALSIWDITNGVRVSSQIVGSTMEFNSTNQGLSVNNINITQYGFPVKYISFQTGYGSNKIVTTKTSAITVDGIERYIPVKLLKSIPSKYDANGIARQAGECGMYDTVNDVFYGNVASDGTFSVSDDN